MDLSPGVYPSECLFIRGSFEEIPGVECSPKRRQLVKWAAPTSKPSFDAEVCHGGEKPPSAGNRGKERGVTAKLQGPPRNLMHPCKTAARKMTGEDKWTWTTPVHDSSPEKGRRAPSICHIHIWQKSHILQFKALAKGYTPQKVDPCHRRMGSSRTAQ